MRRSAFVIGAILAASVLSPIAYATAQNAAEPTSDLNVTVSGPASALPGQRVTYQLTIRNAGPDAVESPGMAASWPRALQVRTSDLIGVSGWCGWGGSPSVTCGLAGGPLASGGSRTVTISGTVDLQATGHFDFQASSGSAMPNDPQPGNNSGTVRTQVGPAADLGVTLTGPATARRGTLITYEAKVTNKGPLSAPGAEVGLFLSGGVVYFSSLPECQWRGFEVVCDLGELARNETKTFKITVRVHEAVPIGGKLQTRATASSNLYDPVPGNDDQIAGTTIVQPPAPPKANVGISGKVGALRKGRNGTYTLTVVNRGPNVAKNVVVAGALPKGLTFKSVRGCKRAGNGIKCTIPNLKSGAKVTIVLTVKVAKSAAGARTYVITAKSATSDPAPGNNTARIKRNITK